MEKAARHYDKIILTLIMCLVVLFMATFSPLAQPASAVAIVDDAIIAIIIAGLAAVGITFATTGGYSTVSEYVSHLLSEFADSRNVTVDTLLSGCQSGTNKLGQIIINNRFVILISTFAAFLQTKFGLQDNEYYNVVQVGYTFGNVVVYPSPFISYSFNGYHTEFNNSVGAYYLVVDTGDSSHTGSYMIYILSEVQTIPYNNPYYRPDNSLITTYTGNYTGSRTGTIGNLSFDSNYYVSGISTQSVSDFNRFMSEVVLIDYQDFVNMLNQNRDVDYNNIGIDITTGEIVLPLDNPDYTDGDGALIDIDVPWGTSYSDIVDDEIPTIFEDSSISTAEIEYTTEDELTEEIEDTSEITNLPAGTIPFTPLQLPQFHLVDIWHYVAQWIEDTAIAAGSLMAIVIQEPHPMVNLFYATVCLAIIFGVIKGFAK